eukprot:COSAG02_NODE_641_length_19049_cov_119.025541_9_plen_94_part_00
MDGSIYVPSLIHTVVVNYLTHGGLQFAIGYVAGKNRASMQAQYGYQIKGVPATGAVQPMPLDAHNWEIHCVPCIHPCALCEEARVAKVSSSKI